MPATPKASWPWGKTMLHSVYDQPDAAPVHAQYDRLVDAVAGKLPKVAAHRDAARADVLAFTGFLEGDLAADLAGQSPGTAELGDPQAHRRRRISPGAMP